MNSLAILFSFMYHPDAHHDWLQHLTVQAIEGLVFSIIVFLAHHCASS
jgi:hypothetical protein